MKKNTLLFLCLTLCHIAFATSKVNLTENILAPDCPILLSPEQGATNVPIDTANNNLVLLSWTIPLSEEPITSYRVFIGQFPDAMNLVSVTPDANASVDGIFFNTTYYWQVIAVSASGNSQDCAIGSFTTLAQTPIVPDHLSNFAVSFNDGWSRASGVIGQRVTKVPTNVWDYFEFANQSDGPNGFAANVHIFNQLTNTNDWFISPLFDLSGGPYYLNFQVALNQFTETDGATLSSEEFVLLLVSEDDGATWTELRRWDQTTPISNLGENSPEITLNQTSNTRFAFYISITNATTSNMDLFIDNFRITSESLLSIDKHETMDFKFYPNPVSSILNLSASQNMKDVAIYNMIGQQVFANRINAMDGAIDMSALPSGNYIARITTENAVKTIKIIKR